MKKPRILYFIQLPPPVHGVSVMNEHVFESEIINNEFDKKLVELKFSSSIKELRKFTIIKVIRMIVIVFKLNMALLTFKPHLIYFSLMPIGWGFIRDLVFILFIKMSRARIIYHIHNQGISGILSNKPLVYLYRFAFNNTSIIHLSKSLIDNELRPLQLKNAFLFAVPNGIPVKNYTKHKKQSSKLQLLFISHINPDKGLHILIDSLNEINMMGISFHLQISGSYFKKKYKKFIESKIEQYNLRNQITFYNEVDDTAKKELFKKADVFIFPSLNDTFGLVVLEAMQAGLPVIVTDSGILTEIIENMKDGIIVKRNNVKDLTDSILLLNKNIHIQEEIGKNAIRKSMDFSLDKFEHKILQVFNKVLSTQTNQ
jgi:glycosyltransferase involved in cell wall biosynthesis